MVILRARHEVRGDLLLSGRGQLLAETHGYLNTLRVILTQFNDETLIASSSTFLVVTMLLAAYWLYNRKRFQQLGHSIPATVVKNYLDSIIQNSSSLKSALFRGGGLDVDLNSIPSVLPLSGMKGGDSVGVASAEEINQKNAQISSLTSRLNEKTSQVGQLETQLADLNGKLKEAKSKSGAGEDPQVPGLKAKIKELEAEIAKLKAGAGAGAGNSAQLAAITKERDELKNRLAEYEIIEDDLANLKRLQQENEQLKKSLAGLGGSVPAAAPAAKAAPAPKAEPEPEPVVEAEPEAVAAAEPEPEPEVVVPKDEPSEDPAEAMASEVSVSSKSAGADLNDASSSASGGDAGVGAIPSLDANEAKSAEDLLSEFEKMLGS